MSFLRLGRSLLASVSGSAGAALVPVTHQPIRRISSISSAPIPFRSLLNIPIPFRQPVGGRRLLSSEAAEARQGPGHLFEARTTARAGGDRKALGLAVPTIDPKSPPPFDTFVLIRDLKKCGFSEDQAITVCEVLKNAVRLSDRHLVTQVQLSEKVFLLKEDLAALHADLEMLNAQRTASRDVELARLRLDIERMHNSLMRFAIGILGTAVAMIIGWKRLTDDTSKPKSSDSNSSNGNSSNGNTAM